MNDQDWNRRAHVRVMRLPKWQIVLLLVVFGSIAVAVALVAAGVFLLALPVVALAVLGYRLFGKRGRERQSSVIDGEYEVIDAAPARHPYKRGRS